MIQHEEHPWIIHKTVQPRRALLVSTYTSSLTREVCEEHLQELTLLADTYGMETVEKFACPLRKIDVARFLGKGKLEEILDYNQEAKADLIIFDDEINPSQQHNLQQFFGVEVIDRTAVILGVFQQRAHSKEARLQVELARLRYEMPRLKRMWTHLSRQQATGGAGAYLKGTGEKQIETDRRLLKEKIHRTEKEINEVRKTRDTQRLARTRQQVPTFAIIGYTNAGKSTLLNALTEADIFVEDKLFATLDTTTRKYALPNNQEVLLIDTVGFIRKIPHLLVAAFRSTLEEALYADILLHLIDGSHPMAYEQAEAAFEVLKELGAEEKPIITVINKIDRCPDKSLIHRIRLLYPRNVQISALQKTGFPKLLEKMEEEIQKRRRKVLLRIPQKDYHVVHQVLQEGKIMQQEYEGNDILLSIEIPASLFGKVEKYEEPSS